MKKRFAAGAAFLFALTACGGGSGGGGAETTAATPISVTAPPPEPGDYYAYEQTDQGTSSDSMAVVTSVSSDGSYEETYLDGVNRFSTHFTSDLGVVSSKPQVGLNDMCTYDSPLIRAPRTLSTGLTWHSDATESCTFPVTYPNGVASGYSESSTDHSTIDGKFIGADNVSVTAGTFLALKYTYKLTSKLLHVASPVSGHNYTIDTEETWTCWRDEKSGRDVKCDVQGTSAEGGSISHTYAYTRELLAYYNGATADQKLPIAAYGGGWEGSYSGADSGICSGLITAAGVVSISCISASSNFTMAGSASLSGVLSLQATSGDMTFTGSSVSPLVLNGTWSSTGGMTGTWTLSRQ